jgi:hypothetical protein
MIRYKVEYFFMQMSRYKQYKNHWIPLSPQTPADQNMVCEEGGVSLLATLLCSPHYPVLISTLKFVASLSHQNPNVSLDIVNAR